MGGQSRLLFLVSAFSLFLELLLIRWIGTELRIFAYLQNTVLVVCFLGLGMGCWTCRRPFAVRELLWPLLLLVLLLALPPSRSALGGISGLLSAFGDLVIWYSGEVRDPWRAGLNVLLGLALTFGLMLLVWSMFVPLGRLIGRLIEDHPRVIRAYSVNVAGSLAGIWLFVALSGLHQPPVAWFAVAALLAWPLLREGSRARRTEVALLAAIVGLAWLAGWQPGALEVAWSPYQKLALFKNAQRPGELGEYTVTVNNVGYQVMIDLSERRVSAEPALFAPEMRGYSQYDLPARFHPAPRKFLGVGTGTGNDVAGALRGGATQVVAVEIDPVIIDLGRRYHPERPYGSPAVQVVNDDARAYFAGSRQKFDVIAFGLLDSHTTTSMTNARLDHYVYTRESLQLAKGLLDEGGILVLSFEATKPYIADRMARVLAEVFGQAPLAFRVPTTAYGWGGLMLVTGDMAVVRRQLEADPRLRGLVTQWQSSHGLRLPGVTPVATDDWPYIYLEYPRIPVLYYLLAGLLALLFLYAMRRLRVRDVVAGWDRTQTHFFLLGAAFMLLEVQNISKASVVLGNTWEVNAVVISGILAMILIANVAVQRFPGLPAGPTYFFLCASCAVLYFVDLASFNTLPYAAKALAVGALASLPMLFSGIVFIRSFAAVRRKDAALGANLMGALAGGLLQSITFVTGLKALLLIVAALYLGALLYRPQPAGRVQPAVS